MIFDEKWYLKNLQRRVEKRKKKIAELSKIQSAEKKQLKRVQRIITNVL